jgi:hypothetical protein
VAVTSSAQHADTADRGQWGLAVVGALGLAVAAVLAAYGAASPSDG